MIKGIGHGFLEKCSWGESEQVSALIITDNVLLDIIALLGAMGNLEWMGIVECRLEDARLITERLIIPKQVVSSAETTLKEDVCMVEGKQYGLLHSHHTMGAFFSSTDREYAIGQYLFNVVVNKELEFQAESLITTPCGGKTSVPIGVRLPTESRDILEALDRISERAYEVSAPAVVPKIAPYQIFSCFEPKCKHYFHEECTLPYEQGCDYSPLLLDNESLS